VRGAGDLDKVKGARVRGCGLIAIHPLHAVHPFTLLQVRHPELRTGPRNPARRHRFSLVKNRTPSMPC
jgi:hypothetical protein